MAGKNRIVLASQSPRRRRMLEEMGIGFDVIPADVDEQMLKNEDPAAFAMRMADKKGRAVAERLAQTGEEPWIIGADTVVVLDRTVLGKPKESGEARSMLRRLAGREHIVITGWTVGSKQGDWIVDHCITKVVFHALSEKQISDYVATGDGMDKAGAYAIQGIGAFLVDSVDGDYFNVVGLPISRVVRTLVDVGALDAFPLS